MCGRRCRPLFPARGKQGNPSLSPAYFRTSRKTAVKPPIPRVCGQIRRVFSKLTDTVFRIPNESSAARNDTPPHPLSGERYRANCRYAFRLLRVHRGRLCSNQLLFNQAVYIFLDGVFAHTDSVANRFVAWMALKCFPVLAVHVLVRCLRLRAVFVGFP